MADDATVLEQKQKDTQHPAEDWTSSSSVLLKIKEGLSTKELERFVGSHVNALAEAHGVSKYRILLFLDARDEISQWHANRIYSAANDDRSDKDTFVVIDSRGGSVEPAYLISKTCKRLSKDRFVVAVPRKAKSAATLLCLGADEIHMGLMSELGPIDPQIGGLPALGLQNALTLLAELSCQHPGASQMLATYLSNKLDLTQLGYFNRVTLSATQYAERLLVGKKLPADQNPKSLGDHFVNHYKDHSFVIDADEAEKLLGPVVIRRNTDEYRFANALYESLYLIAFVCRTRMRKGFDYVGTIDSGFRLFDLDR
jgi:ATP-dependent protease ClpP protease subunit